MASRDAVIQKDTILKGTIRNGGRIEIHGYVEGNVTAETLHVFPGGRFAGQLRANNAEVHGTLQGDAVIKQLISIASTGVVEGNVRYGRIALAAGGELSAELRNIPPEIGGDLEVVVSRGRSVVVTVMDLVAVDPDDKAEDLIFHVEQTENGWIARDGNLRQPVTQFSQSDLDGGLVSFVHDGSDTRQASFKVVVTDKAGATSGAPQTVRAAVLAK